MALFATIALSNKTIRYHLPAALISIIMIFSYGYDLGMYFLHGDWQHRGKFQGHYWFTKEQSNADLLKYLRAAPKGLVLENMWGSAYSNTGRYALFAQKPMVLGWSSHIAGWRNDPASVRYLANDIRNIFLGRAGREKTLAFLRAHKVRCIIWSPEDNQLHNQDWQNIDNAIKPYYFFEPFYRDGANRREKVGIWVFQNNLNFSDIRPASNTQGHL